MDAGPQCKETFVRVVKEKTIQRLSYGMWKLRGPTSAPRDSIINNNPTSCSYDTLTLEIEKILKEQTSAIENTENKVGDIKNKIENMDKQVRKQDYFFS